MNLMDFSEFSGVYPDVSRETFLYLSLYETNLKKWNRAINLVSPETVNEIWERHVVDSVQLHQYLPSNVYRVLDIGSGAGFPGMVLAIVLRGAGKTVKFTLVDSDQRKCEFLRTTARLVELDLSVVADRVESLPAQSCDVVTARALAPLDTLLGYANLHLSPGGIALFPKGENVEHEIESARQNWSFTLNSWASITNPNARVLKIGDLRRV